MFINQCAEFVEQMRSVNWFGMACVSRVMCVWMRTTFFGHYLDKIK